MAILFVHGVNTRSSDLPTVVARYLERYLVGGRFPTPPQVFYSYWGDLGGRYRLGGISRPRTLFTRQGLEQPASTLATTGGLVDILGALPIDPPEEGAPANAGYVGGVGNRPVAQTRLRDSDRLDAIEFLISAAERHLGSDEEMLVQTVSALSELEEDDTAWQAIISAADHDSELAALNTYLQQTVDPGQYVAQGSGRIRRFVDTVGEGLQRVAGAPAAALSTGLGEMRPMLDDVLEEFIGDVFAYLNGRVPSNGVEPVPSDFNRPVCLWEALTTLCGPIPRMVILDLLDAAEATSPGEPLVVLTHSMGGQIVYDIASWFLPRLAVELNRRSCDISIPKIDLWCATASQVGLFEELSLFLASDANSQMPAPFPGAYLEAWWNVWDRNDLLSYTAEKIVDGVEDEEYSTGRSFVSAHSGYLERPSFYKRLRVRVDST